MAGMLFVDLEDRVLAVNDSFCKSGTTPSAG
jgi:hypothetical protein